MQAVPADVPLGWAQLAVEQLRGTLLVPGSMIESLAFSPDGLTLAVANRQREVQLWNLPRRRVRRILKAPGEVYSVVFSPDGQTVASCGGDNGIHLWDVARGSLQQTLQGHRNGVASVAFNAAGTELASGSMDCTVKLWDASTGRLRRSQRRKRRT